MNPTHRHTLVSCALLAGLWMASAKADIPPVYRLIAAKHGLSGESLYHRALRASGRQSAYAREPTPWPWTVRLCLGSRCETVYPATREAMETVLAAGQQAGLTLYVGPLALRWDPATLPLRAATQPRITINAAAYQLAVALQATPRGPFTRIPADRGPPISRNRYPAAANWSELIERVAAEEGLPAALVHAVVAVESRYDDRAVSPKGAVGLMQLMPETAERFGLPRAARTDPERNLRAGTRYLGWLLRYFNGDLTLAIAGYNAGEHRVDRYGRQIPPYPETQQYVRRVVAHLARRINGEPPS